MFMPLMLTSVAGFSLACLLGAGKRRDWAWTVFWMLALGASVWFLATGAPS